ncbi:MAG TPA: hypothetical protein VK169_10000 [Saprospiraceae bacterium]|nr:hypothetical protein [Saprospiraceae bacterium]
MRNVIAIILLTLVCSLYGQNKEYKATRNESHKFKADNIQKLDINVQNAHITINECSGEYIQVNIKVEVKDHNKYNVDREIDWLKCVTEKHKSDIIISNSIVLPKGLKQSPQCKHITYIEIFMPKIESIKINLNIGSLLLDNLKSEINFQTKLCKTTFYNCELKGEFHQTLGESNVNNCTLKGSFIFVNVVSKLSNIMGNLEIDATDSKISLSQQKNAYTFQWDILRSEINWVSSHALLPNLKFEMNASSLTLPSFMQKQTSKLSYHYENKQNKNLFHLKAQNSFINIYNN